MLKVLFTTLFILLLAGCVENAPSSKIVKEQRISDKGVPRFDSIDVIVLPTGERILVMSGQNGLSACCLLPPLAPPKVEK